jgi:hypothetical protein
MKRYTTVFAFIILALPLAASAQTRPCADQTGEARRRCLEREVERSRRELERINAKIARLDRAHQVACDAAELMDRTAEVAQTAGEISRSKPLEYGGQVWTSVRAITSRLLREREGCESARRAVDEARRQRDAMRN